MNENNQLVVLDNGEKMIMRLTDANRQLSFSSMKPVDDISRAEFYNAVNGGDNKRLKDCINMTLEITDVYCEVVDLEDSKTGELVACPRIILFDKDGIGYSCVSKGIFGSLSKLMADKEAGGQGRPTWNPPVPLKVRLISKGTDKSVLTLDIDVSALKQARKTVK